MIFKTCLPADVDDSESDVSVEFESDADCDCGLCVPPIEITAVRYDDTGVAVPLTDDLREHFTDQIRRFG